MKLKIGIVLVLSLSLLALLAPFLPLPAPEATNLDQAFQGPSWEHPLGLDEEGRDVLSRLAFGARLSLGIGLATVLISAVIGISWGLFSAYKGGRVDEFFVMLSDIFLSFPSLLLLIALAAFLEPSVGQMILLLSFVGWVGHARLARSEALSLKSRDYVAAARSLGYSTPRILWRHLLPNAAGPLLVNASLSLAGVIIAESSLSFLGLGLPDQVPSWGRLLDSGVAYLLIAPHLSLFAGLMIMLSVLGFNFLGEGLREKIKH